MKNNSLRVLVIDDSAVVREALCKIISSHPQLEVMGTAGDPFQAAQRIKEEVPDVITLDVEMPRMDGITFLRKLMSQRPVPVVICSSLVGDGTKTLMASMDAGAVEIVQKPAVGTKQFLEDSAIQIQDKIIAAASARLTKRAPQSEQISFEKSTSSNAMHTTTQTVVAVGASTGGTEALKYLLSSLPPFAPPMVIVQHMPENFTKAFAKLLDDMCQITVREARNGDSVLRGQALIAPGNKHMTLYRHGANYGVKVVDGPLVSRHRPSVDVLFKSTAKYAGGNAVGVIMTGMGSDGAEGLKAMRDAGARTIGQNENTCVVYGMSRVAMQLEAVENEVSLDSIPNMLIKLGKEKVA